MSTLGWLLLAGFSVGCVWGWRLAFMFFTRTIPFHAYDITWGTVVGSMALATLVCALWPLMAALVAFVWATDGHDAKQFAFKVGGRTPYEKHKERERALKEREARIARLEHDLEIKS